MEERKLTEKESLEVITSMIARTRERYMLGDGNILLMWGYLTVAVTTLIWILLVLTHNPAWNWLWFLIWIIGGTAMPIMTKGRERAKTYVKSYSDKLTSQIWSIVGYGAMAATAFCLGFLLFKGIDTWLVMFSIALVFVPFAEIAQGIIINEKSMKIGGGIGLLAGIFTMCCIAGRVPLGVNWYLPIFIVVFACMMIIPGHILNYKARKQQ